MPYIGHVRGSEELVAAVARRTRRRLATLHRRLVAAGAGASAATALLADCLSLPRRGGNADRIWFAADLRALTASLELALRLRHDAALAALATSDRDRDPAVARLFAAVADTPHLLEIAPDQRPGRGFPRRAAALAVRLLAAARADLPLALIAHARGEHRGRRFPLAAREEPETATARFEFPLGGTPLVLVVTGPCRGLALELTRDHLVVHSGRRTLLRAPRSPLAPAAGNGARLVARRLVDASPSLRIGRRLVSRPGSLRVGPCVAGLAARLGQALELLRAAWPEAWREAHLFTELVVPLDEPGTVSYSLPSRPGVSYVNVWKKSLLELTDDLLHEAAHHKLHAVEELEPLVADGGGDGGDPIWWSPWRRAWRPLRGIVHATYTFAYGALLFARLTGLPPAALTPGRRRFAARRLLEEEASIAFSIRDLVRAGREARLSVAGNEIRREIAALLAGEIGQAARRAERELGRGGEAGRRALAGIARHRRALAAMREVTPGEVRR